MSDNGCVSAFVLGLAVCGVGNFLLTRRKSNEVVSQQQVVSAKSSSNKGFHHFEERLALIKDDQHKGCVYMDYNATTPVFPEVFQAMSPFLTSCFGNPSSSHIYSKTCKEAVFQAREHVGNLVNAKSFSDEIYFTSCGTESDNQAILTAIHNYYRRRKDIVLNTALPHIITCSIEHPAVLSFLWHLVDENRIKLTIVSVSSEGVVVVDEIREALSKDTSLVTIMHSNNEVGIIQPIREISNMIRTFNRANNCHVLFHSDAAQSLGKVNIDVQALGVDMLTIVGHKFGAPKGVAALYVKHHSGQNKNEAIEVYPMLIGGGQERGTRGGTENVALIVGLGEASRIAVYEFQDMFIHLLTLKHAMVTGFRTEFADQLDSLCFNGPARASDPKEIANDLKMIRAILGNRNSCGAESAGATTKTDFGTVVGSTSRSCVICEDLLESLPNTVSVSFRGILSHEVLAKLYDKIACSAGSACHATSAVATAAKDTEPSTSTTVTSEIRAVNSKMSHVLAAMKVDQNFAHGTLRISFGRHSTLEEVNITVREISAVVREAWLASTNDEK